MTTRAKIDMQSLVKEAIREIFANEEFLNQLIKTVSDKIEQNLKCLQDTVNIQAHKINEMEWKIDDLKQQEKISSICIYGIPDDENETDSNDLTSQVIEYLNKQIPLDLKNECITALYRVGLKRNYPNKARPIIMKLINHDYKILLLKNAKYLKGKHIFITEDLTKKRRELLMTAKSTLGKSNAWSFNGQIFIKVNEQSVKIRSKDDILEYKK